MTTFTLPELGEGIETAEVTRLLVKEGDVIKAEQNVMDLDSEKASFPLPSPSAGRVAKIHVKDGQSIHVGQPLLDIEEVSAAQKKPPRETAPSASAPEKAQTQEAKTATQPAAEAERPRDATAPRGDGHLAKGHAEAKPPIPEQASPVPAGPATRRLARELGVDLRQVHGSGAHGRITREDVKAHVHERLSRAAPSLESPALPDFSRWGPIRRERLSALGRTAAQRLSLAWRTIPHVTQHELADVTDLESARRMYLEKVTKTKAKITMTVLCVHAALAALKVFPKFNSSLDLNSGELILKDYYHIGVAVDTDHGLLVPVIRDADRKTMLELATELDEAARKARERTLAPKDMEGATFTISNLGGIGGTFFTPIINNPEVAILGVSRAQWQPAIRDGAMVKRLMLPLSLSYDHRVINGADATRFVVKVAGLLSGAFELLAEA
jgi:pyruvate dehydrogenase E2 component (dihydrolipoamide acetyltransferase)